VDELLPAPGPLHTDSQPESASNNIAGKQLTTSNFLAIVFSFFKDSEHFTTYTTDTFLVLLKLVSKILGINIHEQPCLYNFFWKSATGLDGKSY
jgi:hypothetical protein